jgi:hypothetical protein
VRRSAVALAGGLAVLLCGLMGVAAWRNRPLPPVLSALDEEAAAWFQTTGCTACHAVSPYRLNVLAARAPDLARAVENVPRRTGRPLESFMEAPTGTMAVVLGQSIRLTARGRAEAVRWMTVAHERMRRR